MALPEKYQRPSGRSGPYGRIGQCRHRDTYRSRPARILRTNGQERRRRLHRPLQPRRNCRQQQQGRNEDYRQVGFPRGRNGGILLREPARLPERLVRHLSGPQLSHQRSFGFVCIPHGLRAQRQHLLPEGAQRGILPRLLLL